MKKEWAKKWVKALRSGKYKRGTGQLKKGDKYCCLGVLCEITGKPYDGDRGNLPVEVRVLVNTNNHSGYIENEQGETTISLIHLNDHICPAKKKGFKYIADIIEKHWEKL